MLLLILASFLIKILFWQSLSGIFLQIDTYGYYETGQKMYKNRIISDYSRPPVYPLLITLPAFINGRIETPVHSPEFVKDMQLIILIQIVISTVSLWFLYRILLMIKVKKLIAYIFMLLIILNINYFGADMVLLTESLTASWLIFTVFFSIKLLNRFSLLNLFVLTVLFLFGFLTKPFYTIFPLLILTVLNFHYRFKKVLLTSLMSLFIYFLAVFLYTGLNQQYYGFRGISRISGYNLLGVILKRGINMEPARNTFLYKKIKDYRVFNREMNSFRIMEFIDPSYYRNNKLLTEMNNFNAIVLSKSFPEYFLKSSLAVPRGQLEINDTIVLPPVSSVFYYPAKILQKIYASIQYITLIVIPGFIYLSFKFFKKSPVYHAWILMGAISACQIILSVFFSYDSFGRLISPVQPFLYLFSFYCWIAVYKYFRIYFKK